MVLVLVLSLWAATAACGATARYGDRASGPATGTEPTDVGDPAWRAVVDPLPGLSFEGARQRWCDHGAAAATAPAPDQHVAVYGPDGGGIEPPWLWVGVAPSSAVAVEHLRATVTTVNGRDAWVDARTTGVVEVEYPLDDVHTVRATGWGIDLVQIGDALASLTWTPDGGIALTRPPAGTTAMATSTDDAITGELQASARLPIAEGRFHWISIATVRGDPSLLERRLAGIVTPSPVVPAGVLEAFDVRGSPGLARWEPGSMGQGLSAVWWDAAVGRVVTLGADLPPGVGLDEVLASVRDLDDAAWAALLARCPDPRAPTEYVSGC